MDESGDEGAGIQAELAVAVLEAAVVGQREEFGAPDQQAKGGVETIVGEGFAGIADDHGRAVLRALIVQAGKVLGGEPIGIPIYRDLGTALAHAGRAPDHLIVGIDPASGDLSHIQRRLLLRAIGYGINIVNGLDKLLNDDPEFAAACAKSGAVIRDLKKLG